MLKKLLAYFIPQKEIVSPSDGRVSDELLGKWFNWAGDDSGMAMIWGYGLEFKEQGLGISHHWESSIPKGEQTEPFSWERIGEKRIRIKCNKDLKSEWEEISYEISNYIGGYKGKYDRLREKGKEEFWCCPDPIHRSSRERL